MDNKPSFDRSLFIPIFIGFISVVGICLVLLASRLSAARGNVQVGETETPVKYQYLATEPGVVFPTQASTPTEPPTALAPTSPIVFASLTSTAFVSPTLSPVVNRPNATNTPTTTPTVQFLNVTYDDADFKFLYTGNWVGQSGVSGTYQNTLHISNAIGDAVQLSFAGQKIRFTYQAGPSLGTVAVKLDGVDFPLAQSAPETILGAWESAVLVLSSHVITITHISGGSINIDSIAVLDISTPTPTVTATP